MSCNFCRCTKPWWYFCNPVLLPSFLFSLWLPLGLFCFDHVEFAMTNFNDLKENHQQTLKWLSTVDRGINTHYCAKPLATVESHFSVCWWFSFKSFNFFIENSTCLGKNNQQRQAWQAWLRERLHWVPYGRRLWWKRCQTHWVRYLTCLV